MAITIRKASRSRVFLKLAVQGPSGSGKSFSALKIARGLVGPNGKIGAIDTENGSMSLYSHLTDFDVADLDDFSPESYVDAIKAFEAAGYDCLVIDSISHAWKYILEQKAAMDARGGNAMMNWKGPKERYAKLTTAVLQSKMHVIGCMRAKTEYVQNEGAKGYSKAGLAAVAEPDSEFEYTVVFSMGMDHRALCGVDGQGKDRTGMFDRLGSFMPGESTGELLAKWLQDAPDQEVRQTRQSTPNQATEDPSRDSQATKPVPSTGAYLRDVMGMDTATLDKYKAHCLNNGFNSKDVTPILMAAEVKTYAEMLDVVAVLVGLKGMGIEPTPEVYAELIGYNDTGFTLLEILDQATNAGIPDMTSLFEFIDSLDEDQETGQEEPVGERGSVEEAQEEATKVEQKPAPAGRGKKKEEGVAA